MSHSQQPPLRDPYDFSNSYNDNNSQLDYDPLSGGARSRRGTWSSSGNADDRAVKETNDDASGSRLSAAELGYISDPYISAFTRRSSMKRSPVINRGSYLRFACINRLIAGFVNKFSGKCQIVSLGAGSDTRFFLLKQQMQLSVRKYFELDFADIVSRKIQSIQQSRLLMSCFQDADRIRSYGSDFDASEYHLLSCDLREWDEVTSKLESRGLDYSLPTLVLSECVLIYMDVEHSDRIVKYVADRFETAAFITYEQILPDDAFGRMMISNLMQRNISLKSISTYPNLEAQRKRYIDAGFNQCETADMITVYEDTVDDSEKLRISKIELLDELEEWVALCKHYCITWATKGQTLQDNIIKLIPETKVNK